MENILQAVIVFRCEDDLPWGDLIPAVDDAAGNPGHCDRALDVFSSLAEVRAWNSHDCASLHGAGHWVQLKHNPLVYFFLLMIWGTWT